MYSDQSTFHYPHRTSASSYRVPTPPRIVVPPPTLNAEALPEITLKALQDSDLLRKVSYDKLVKQNAILEWNYEWRREAQMILPYLYLGPLAAAKDETWLKREEITCLLGVRQKGAFQSRLLDVAMSKAKALGIEGCGVDVVNNADLIHSFPATTAQIHNHIAQSLQSNGKMGKLLVFCESGNDRSAAVVAAYLMEMYEDVDHIKAMQLCQAQRFCVNFDDGLKRLLQGYWDILCAKRQVEQNWSSSSIDEGSDEAQSKPAKGKRTLERDEDGDDAMMDGMDEDDLERFGGRQFAPFVDEAL
jgi:serine/threonine/tyrosine-interacting protein